MNTPKPNTYTLVLALALAVLLSGSIGFAKGNAWRAKEEAKQSEKITEAIHAAIVGPTTPTTVASSVPKAK